MEWWWSIEFRFSSFSLIKIVLQTRDHGDSLKATAHRKQSPDCFSTLQLQKRAHHALFQDKCKKCRQTGAEKVPNTQPLITSQRCKRGPLKDAGLTERTPSVCDLRIQWAQGLQLYPGGFNRKGRSEVLLLVNSSCIIVIVIIFFKVCLVINFLSIHECGLVIHRVHLKCAAAGKMNWNELLQLQTSCLSHTGA